MRRQRRDKEEEKEMRQYNLQTKGMTPEIFLSLFKNVNLIKMTT